MADHVDVRAPAVETLERIAIKMRTTCKKLLIDDESLVVAG